MTFALLIAQFLNGMQAGYILGRLHGWRAHEKHIKDLAEKGVKNEP